MYVEIRRELWLRLPSLKAHPTVRLVLGMRKRSDRPAASAFVGAINMITNFFVEEEAEAKAGAAEMALKSTASASLVGAPLCTDGANSTNEHVR